MKMKTFPLFLSIICLTSCTSNSKQYHGLNENVSTKDNLVINVLSAEETYGGGYGGNDYKRIAVKTKITNKNTNKEVQINNLREYNWIVYFGEYEYYSYNIDGPSSYLIANGGSLTCSTWYRIPVDIVDEYDKFVFKFHRIKTSFLDDGEYELYWELDNPLKTQVE